MTCRQNVMNEQCKKKIIVVLGMHRSGTSLLSRSLKIFGMHDDSLKNKFWNPHKYNATGFWENSDIMGLNNRILSHIGQTWHSVPPVPHDVYETLYKSTFFEEAVQIIQQCFNGRNVYALKEPRVTKLLPFWKKVFSACDLEVKYLFSFRHPTHVASSLRNRDNFLQTKCILLWFIHNIFSLKEVLDENVLFVEYEDFLENTLVYIDIIELFIGEKRNTKEEKIFLESFLDKNLCHHKTKKHYIKQIMPCYELYFDMKRHQRSNKFLCSLERYFAFYEKNKYIFFMFDYQHDQQISDVECNFLKKLVSKAVSRNVFWEDMYLQLAIVCSLVGDLDSATAWINRCS